MIREQSQDRRSKVATNSGTVRQVPTASKNMLYSGSYRHHRHDIVPLGILLRIRMSLLDNDSNNICSVLWAAALKLSAEWIFMLIQKYGHSSLSPVHTWTVAPISFTILPPVCQRVSSVSHHLLWWYTSAESQGQIWAEKGDRIWPVLLLPKPTLTPNCQLFHWTAWIFPCTAHVLSHCHLICSWAAWKVMI